MLTRLDHAASRYTCTSKGPSIKDFGNLDGSNLIKISQHKKVKKLVNVLKKTSDMGKSADVFYGWSLSCLGLNQLHGKVHNRGAGCTVFAKLHHS